MKKIAIILIGVLAIALLGFFGWYLLLRNPDIPVGEAIIDILPFGSGGDGNATVSPSGDIDDTGGTTGQVLPIDGSSAVTANLFLISNTPIAGAVVFEKENKVIVRYVDRATGHIYDAALPTQVNSTTLEKTRVTNNTLPKIYEAYFRLDGNAVLLRSLENDSDVVENLSLALTPPRATSSNALYSVSSTALRGDISSVTAGSGNTLFYAVRDTTAVVSSAFNGTGLRTLLKSAFTDWHLSSAGNSLVIYTKASASAPGYAYALNSSTGTLRKILGPLNGLTAVPNTSGNRVVYSYTDNGVIRAFAKNLVNNSVTEILPTALAEKCIWSIKQTGILFCAAPIDESIGGEPDNWYRGVTHFSDRIWFFDTDADIAQVLVEPNSGFGVDIDVINPKLSPDEDYLVFTNKTDLSLWALKLERF